MFDNDFDNAMETVQMGHATAVAPHCVTHYRLWVDNILLAEVIDNRHSVCEYRLPEAISAQQVKLEMVKQPEALPPSTL